MTPPCVVPTFRPYTSENLEFGGSVPRVAKVGLIQELIADGCHDVTRYQPTTDKVMRLNAQTTLIENGFVRIPENAPWLAEYLHELTVFPNGKHDDQADSTAQFLDWFKKPFPGQGHYEWMRMEYERLQNLEKDRERHRFS